jgi:hypothetical protein
LDYWNRPPPHPPTCQPLPPLPALCRAADGRYCAVDASFQGTLLELVLLTAVERGWRLDSVPADDMAAALQPLGYDSRRGGLGGVSWSAARHARRGKTDGQWAHKPRLPRRWRFEHRSCSASPAPPPPPHPPCRVTLHFLHCYGSRLGPDGSSGGGASAMEADAAVSGGQPGEGEPSGLYALDEAAVCVHFAQALLAEAPDWELAAFEAEWRRRVPEVGRGGCRRWLAAWPAWVRGIFRLLSHVGADNSRWPRCRA